jgi:hypothetical protein
MAQNTLLTNNTLAIISFLLFPCLDDVGLGTEENNHNRTPKLPKPYVFLNSVNPKLGKLSNPHESPTPLKNHLKQLQKKLTLTYFPRERTCFL